LIAGVGVLVRPDTGLIAVAIGVTLIVSFLFKRNRLWRQLIGASAICLLLFTLVLLPWTIRNWHTFHVFQPLGPATATMPDEFFPHGYSRWLRTWLDDQRYVDHLWWVLDNSPISIKEIPDRAFDSAEERNRVAALLDKYNNPAEATDGAESSATAAKVEPSERPDEQSADNSGRSNTDSRLDEDESDSDEGQDKDSSDSDASASQPVDMTPEIDRGFGQIADERISRRPLRYYLWMPIKRSAALWFNTHSDYYPFSGDLFPLDELDYDTHQHLWLPLFACLVGFYSFIGLLGGIVLWLTRSFQTRIALLLLVMIFVTRFVLFSFTESLEPRYVVELFPFFAALGGGAAARILQRVLRRESGLTT
jgi:4-amino-4-deoxy-L-arabinose transferase-like glycosyltransferase